MHTIRPAQPHDIPTILRFVRELAEYERAADKVVATEDMLREHLFGELRPGRARVECLIAELHSAPAGFALYFHNFSTWLARSGIYLEDLYVTPAARGRGLGLALLRRLAHIAVTRDCGRVEWAVLTWNTPARGFYESLGAAPLDEWIYYRLTGEALKELAAADSGT
ncbi:MAG: GNAT family N-acetyltransferase [Phycisphaerales bacterium]|nr:GNAT family N-acetyltransferase [Phycisphaerales bacterium]